MRRAHAPLVAVLVMSAVAACSSSTTAAPTVAAPTATSATPTPTPSTTPSEAPTPTPTVTPKPTTAKATPHETAKKTTPAPAPFRFPVPVSVGNATQIITVDARGSYANVDAWSFSGGRWHHVLTTTAARVGANGVVPGTERVQGSNTTPGGTYTLTEAFGINANPGAHLSYHQVTSDDWWVEDNNSAYYNQMRTASQGGFTLTEAGVNGSEQLITHTVPYQYAVVINFNRPPRAVRYRGAGIFLHVNGAGSTAGCVSVPLATMVALMRWLDPSAHPRISIA